MGKSLSWSLPWEPSLEAAARAIRRRQAGER
jgi:hypothetical protein